LEQLPYPRTLETMMNQYGYKLIAVHQMNDPFDVWYEADPDILEYFKKGGTFTLDMLQWEGE